MGNVLDKRYREKQNTHFMFNNFPPENLTVYEIMWKNMIEPDRQNDNIKRRMRFECRIPKATNKHSEYVLLIAFPLQQWFHERASMLRYTYVA